MKIVFFNFVTNYGGAARSEVWLADRLKSSGMEPIFVEPYGSSKLYKSALSNLKIEHHVLTPHEQGRLIGGNGKLQRCYNVAKELPDLRRIRKAASHTIKHIKPDIICCQDFKAATLIASIPSLNTIPLAMYLREWYVPQMVPRIGKSVWHRRCAGLVAVSHATRAAVHCSHIPFDKIHVLQNPIDVEDHNRIASTELHGSLPQADRALKMILPAFIQERKQQHVAVAAAKRLKEMGLDFTLWMAGGLGIPDPANARYYEHCRKQTEKLGLTDNVFWLDYRDDIPQIIRQSDIVLQPSRREGHPRVMLEAMALAKPYVAAPIAGHIEMVLPHLTGMLHEVGDDLGMAQCIRWIHQNPEEAKQIGATAKRLVEQSHRPDSHTAKAMEIFEKIIVAHTKR